MKLKLNKHYHEQKNCSDVTLSDSAQNKKQLSKEQKKRKRVRRIVGWSIFGVLLFTLVFNIFLLPLSSKDKRVAHVENYSGDNRYVCFDETSLISAHRAGGELAPEETLMAFELCMNASDYVVDIVEFDLHLTKDDVLVLMHDDTVDRTSNGKEYFGDKDIKVIDKTYDELRQLNFGENFKALDGSYPYRGLRGNDIPNNVKILSLHEILTYLTSVRANLNYIIEIKDGGDDGEKAMDILYATMEKFGITERTIVGTFKGNVTKHIDKKYSNLTRSASIIEVLNFYYSFLYNTKLNADKIKFDVLQIPMGLAMFNLATQSFVDYAHTYGIAVQYWTINEPKDVSELISIGADAIITDNPEVAYEVLHK